jgi:hypothetical protein
MEITEGRATPNLPRDSGPGIRYAVNYRSAADLPYTPPAAIRRSPAATDEAVA